MKEALLTAIEDPVVQTVMEEGHIEILIFNLLKVLSELNSTLYPVFVRKLLRVCCSLFKRINQVTLRHLVLHWINYYTSPEKSSEERAIGYEILGGVIHAHLEYSIDPDYGLRSQLLRMTNDRSIFIRKQFLIISSHLLAHIKQSGTKAGNNIASKVIKLFTELIHDQVVTAIGLDIWTLVIEGLIIMHEFPALFQVDEFSTLYKPAVEKLYSQVSQLRYQVRLKLSKEQGRILNCLYKEKLLDQKLERQIFTFFKECMENDLETDGETLPGELTPQTPEVEEDFGPIFMERIDVQSMTVNAAQNLPCFFINMTPVTSPADQGVYLILNKQKGITNASRPDYQTELLNLAFKLSRPDEPNIAAKETLIVCLHELLKSKSQHSHLRKIIQILNNLVVSCEIQQQLIATICSNLGLVLDNLFTNIDQHEYGQLIVEQRNQMLQSLDLAFFFQDLCGNLGLEPPIKPLLAAKQAVNEDEFTFKVADGINCKDTSLGHEMGFTSYNRTKQTKPFETPVKPISKSFDKQRIKPVFPPTLQKYLPLESLQNHDIHEAFNHPVLDSLHTLFKLMLQRKGANYRSIGFLLEILANRLAMFNSVAVDHYFAKKVLEYMPVAPECIQSQLTFFIVQLIKAQYKASSKEDLIGELHERMRRGNAKQRVRFIRLVLVAMTYLDDRTFVDHFLNPIAQDFGVESDINVLTYYLEVLPVIWSHVIKVAEDSTIKHVYEMTMQARQWPKELKNQVIEIRTKIKVQFTTDLDNRARQIPKVVERKQAADDRIQNSAMQRQLMDNREIYEQQVVKRVKQEQENKRLLEPSTYQLPRSSLKMRMKKTATLELSRVTKSSRKSSIMPKKSNAPSNDNRASSSSKSLIQSLGSSQTKLKFKTTSAIKLRTSRKMVRSQTESLPNDQLNGPEFHEPQDESSPHIKLSTSFDQQQGRKTLQTVIEDTSPDTRNFIDHREMKSPFQLLTPKALEVPEPSPTGRSELVEIQASMDQETEKQSEKPKVQSTIQFIEMKLPMLIQMKEETITESIKSQIRVDQGLKSRASQATLTASLLNSGRHQRATVSAQAETEDLPVKELLALTNYFKSHHDLISVTQHVTDRDANRHQYKMYLNSASNVTPKSQLSRRSQEQQLRSIQSQRKIKALNLNSIPEQQLNYKEQNKEKEPPKTHSRRHIHPSKIMLNEQGFLKSSVEKRKKLTAKGKATIWNVEDAIKDHREKAGQKYPSFYQQGLGLSTKKIQQLNLQSVKPKPTRIIKRMAKIPTAPPDPSGHVKPQYNTERQVSLLSQRTLSNDQFESKNRLDKMDWHVLTPSAVIVKLPKPQVPKFAFQNKEVSKGMCSELGLRGSFYNQHSLRQKFNQRNFATSQSTRNSNILKPPKAQSRTIKANLFNTQIPAQLKQALKASREQNKQIKLAKGLQEAVFGKRNVLNMPKDIHSFEKAFSEAKFSIPSKKSFLDNLQHLHEHRKQKQVNLQHERPKTVISKNPLGMLKQFGRVEQMRMAQRTLDEELNQVSQV